MSPTLDFLNAADKQIRKCLEGIRPKLLESQGNIEHRFKDDKTIVTEMDVNVEDALAAALKELDPAIPFSGEERGVDFGKPTYWLVDPIDGTEPFMRGMPFASNMVSLIDNDEAVLGVIYNFTLGDYYLAIKGHGASCNGHPIRVSDRAADRAWVSYSVSAGKLGASGFADKLNDRVLSIRRYGAAGFDYSMLASGALEGRVVFNGHGREWDFAPGMLLVSEAGGKVANVGTDSYDFRNFNHVAANPAIFDALMEFISEIARDAKDTAS